MKVKTLTIEYDTEAEVGSRADQPNHAAAFIQVWNQANENPPDQETFVVIGLDSRHHVTSAETLTKGTHNQAPVDARRLFRHLLAVDAHGFIISHNHPSGDLEPSRDDLLLTERLAEGGKVIGIQCLDHIITTPAGTWLSLRAVRPGIFS